MMKKYKLKKWVLPSMGIMAIGIILLNMILITNFMNKKVVKDDLSQFVPDEIIKDETMNVVEITNETVNHPYLAESVEIAKNYYDKDMKEEDQLKSLIYYKNSYMENTGVLYSNKEKFDVVSVLDGTVTSITDDEILGKVVEVSHSTELITVYHCLENVAVKVGDTVKQNDTIGTSGKVNIDKGYENALLFEVNYKGSIINPNNFYNMKISDLIK